MAQRDLFLVSYLMFCLFVTFIRPGMDATAAVIVHEEVRPYSYIYGNEN